MYQEADCEKYVYRKDFVPELAKRTGLTTRKAEEVLDAFVDMVTEYWSEETNVCLTGFGTFRIRKTSERMARNPRTMEEHLIPAGFKPEFRLSRGLRAKIDEKIKERHEK